MKPFLFIPAILISIFAIGCSTSSPDKADLKETFTSYVAAQAAGDWKAMCSNLNRASVNYIVKESKKKTCADGMNALPDAGKAQLKKTAKSIKSPKFSVKGETGEILAENIGGVSVVPAVIEDGAWKISIIRSNS